jgi:hypothetical protein
MNLGHEGAVDNAGFVEDLITALLLACMRCEAQVYSPCPLGVPYADLITNGVVFKSK